MDFFFVRSSFHFFTHLSFVVLAFTSFDAVLAQHRRRHYSFFYTWNQRIFPCFRFISSFRILFILFHWCLRCHLWYLCAKNTMKKFHELRLIVLWNVAKFYMSSFRLYFLLSAIVFLHHVRSRDVYCNTETFLQYGFRLFAVRIEGSRFHW